MKATILYSLRRFRGSILGWGFGLFLLGFGATSAYPMVQQQSELLSELLDNLPDAITAFIGDKDEAFSPRGFLHARFFMLMPVILGVFAALAGSGLLVHDEETGRLDLIAAHPVSRAELFFGRVAALTLTTAVILALGWIGIAVGMWKFSIPLSGWAVFPAVLNLAAVIVFIESIALLLSMLLPARRHAGMTTGLMVVISFFVTGLSQLIDALEPLARILPLYYYQGGQAIGDFNWLYFVGLLLAAAGCFSISYWRFEARDIRVAGEGSWAWRKVGISAAMVLSVAVVTTAVASWPKRYDSPEQAFAAAMRALDEQDWESFSSCLTSESIDEWNAVMVLFGSLLETRLEGQDPAAALGRIEDRLSEEQLNAILEVVAKLQRAMIHVDRAALRKRRGNLLPAAIAALATGSFEIDDQTRELSQLVNDPREFLSKAMEAWSVIYRYPQLLTIDDVRVDRDTARAVMILGDGQHRAIDFKRIDGSWRVGLPFLVGDRRMPTPDK